MCGRFAITEPDRLPAHFGVDTYLDMPPRFNIAPTEPVLIVRDNRDNGRREMPLVRWGLIPAWARDPDAMRAPLINARADSVAEKPTFRNAYRYRRCLVPADGFYEWQKKVNYRQPWYFRMQEDTPFAFAGLWELWQGPNGEELESCTLLTTDANDMLAEVHHRMPVILDKADYDRWLDPNLSRASDVQRELAPLLRPFASDRMAGYPVSTRVNNTNHDDLYCIQPIE